MADCLLNTKMAIHFPAGANVQVLEELFTSFSHGVECKSLLDAPEGCIWFGEEAFCETELPDGAEYVIDSTQQGVCVRGSDRQTTVRGFLDLLQKLKYDHTSQGCIVPTGRIVCRPEIAFRSVHICIFPETTLDFLRKCVRVCALAGYTHMVLEFWGMLQMDCLKELAWPFAYSKEAVRGVVQEANALGMEIIPMFNHLGHAAASREIYGKHVVLDQNPAYEYMFNDCGWEWDFENPQVYELLAQVRRELIDVCGEGSYFHLGCDEAYALGMQPGSEKKMIAYLNRVSEDLETLGRRGIIWGDMLLSRDLFENEKEFYTVNSTPEVACAMREGLSKRLIIADWQYFTKGDAWLSSQILRKSGFDVLCCPFDDMKNVASSVRAAKEAGGMGVMKTTWHTLANGFPVMLYGGRVAVRSEGKYVHQLLMHETAALVRKACPAKGDYTKAGWSEKQVGPGL